MARYNPDGGLDASFGQGGVVCTSLGPSASFAVALGLLRQADGKLVAAGFSLVDQTRFFDFTLVRYNPDGSLDPGFGEGGVVRTDFFLPLELAFGVVQQSDGKLVAAGAASACIDACDTASPVLDSNFALARYNPNGSLDTTFFNTGQTTVNFGALTALPAPCCSPMGGSWPRGNRMALLTGPTTSPSFVSTPMEAWTRALAPWAGVR